jgi:hypothetical protein
MKFFTVEPEVAGGFGSNTILSTESHPPVVTRLHYQFDGWLGDELLECFPCYIVTQQLGKAIEREGMSGVDFDQVEISTSELFDELYPGRKLPKFLWMKVAGKAGRDDFGVSPKHKLVISERAFDILQKFASSNCDVTPWRKR